MCGIAAYFTRRPHDACLAQKMAQTIRHRGPDDEGYLLIGDSDSLPQPLGGADSPASLYTADLPHAPRAPIDNGYSVECLGSLAHRRLSILDLSDAGHQPMCLKDQHLWIVFNGEIYNFLELKQELAELGHRFFSQTDTEVILAAHKQWGRACLHRFRGMFAFVIYDHKLQCVFAARDHFGIKPLYYWVSDQGIAFASEIKQFTVLPGWQAKVNGQRAYDFLTWGIIDHTEETLFKGVFQLRGGQCLHLDLRAALGSRPHEVGQRLAVEDWYRPEDAMRNQGSEGGPEEFKRRFMESMRLHLRSDVPVGSCLSGGLDSSAVVCAVHALRQQDLDPCEQLSFSACANDPRFDERQWAELVVKKTGVTPHYIYPSGEDLFQCLDGLTWHQDEPFGSASIYYQWQVFQLAAANGIKVVLDGQGADEMLAGYHSFFGPYLAHMLRQAHFSQFWQEASAIRRVHGYSTTRQVQWLANVFLPESMRQSLRAAVGKPAAKNALLDMERLQAQAVDPSIHLHGKMRTVTDFSLAQMRSLNLPMLLHCEDRNSMAHSVEARVPFLDSELASWVLGLPDTQKIRGGVTKWIMRQALGDMLPPAVTGRMDKMGFVTPEEVWLREQHTSAFRQAFTEALNASQGIFRAGAEQRLEDVISGQRAFSFDVWRVISFGRWMQCFRVEL